MDGLKPISKILKDFKQIFDVNLTATDFTRFAQQIAEYGLLEPYYHRGVDESAGSTISLSAENEALKPDFDVAVLDVESIPSGRSQRNSTTSARSSNRSRGHWRWGNPERLFFWLHRLGRPIYPLIVLLVWSLWILVPLALVLLFKHQLQFWGYTTDLKRTLSFFASFLFHVFALTVTGKIAQSVLLASYGIPVQEFGILRLYGILPLPYFKTGGRMRQLNRVQLLWVYATPLLTRLFFFSLGTLIWFCNQSTGTLLGFWALSLAQAALISFVLLAAPFWGAGYNLIATYFQFSQNPFRQGVLIIRHLLQRRPLPASLSWQRAVKLITVVLVVSGLWGYTVFALATGLGDNLNQAFPQIFGKGTPFILSVVFLLMAAQWFVQIIASLLRSRSDRTRATHSDANQLFLRRKQESWLKKGLRFITWLVVLAVIMYGLSLPYHYNPSGQIQLLPPEQQLLQAQVEGRVTTVFFDGGDGRVIRRGTVIANVVSTDVENNVLTLQQQIQQQQAFLQKQINELNKLRSMPRPEEVRVAQIGVSIAREELAVAQQELVSKQTTASYNTRQIPPLEQLYKEGAIALVVLENQKEEAETAQIAVEGARKNVAAKSQTLAKEIANLDLLLSGPYKDEIAAAQQDVEASRAELQRLVQERRHAQNKVKTAQLIMPIDGQISTPYLKQKVGSYLKIGDTFATIENNRNIMGEVQIPEYNVGDIRVGARVEIKLFAYPTAPLFGQVLSIQPTAAEEQQVGRTIGVIVSIPNSRQVLKSGMTGYAKIQGGTEPVIVAFTRPLIRFFQIEFWSWIP